MLTFEPAETEQYEEFMRLMLDEARDYLEETQKLMQMSTEEFNHLFRTVGHVYAIHDDERCAGAGCPLVRERCRASSGRIH